LIAYNYILEGGIKLQTIFKFRCVECGKEVITDGVVYKCCNRLMEQKEAYHLTEAEIVSLVQGFERLDEIVGRKA
jgi:hypothetical protein